jgi:hypothetical protein
VQLARTRWLFLMMWMAKLGTGIVPSKDMLNAAKRLRVTQDVEIELDRWGRGPGRGWHGWQSGATRAA